MKSKREREEEYHQETQANSGVKMQGLRLFARLIARHHIELLKRQRNDAKERAEEVKRGIET